jgi:toxin-antitoxin system PIN domain toxin
MMILDANLLLYAVNRDAPMHAGAKAWIEGIFSGEEEIGLSWNVILAFLRLTTRPGLFRKPLSIERALSVMSEWLNRPNVTVIHPGPRHLELFRELIVPLGSAGNLTSDVHLAALALENNARLCSCDTDFGRFRGLDWMNPLA